MTETKTAKTSTSRLSARKRLSGPERRAQIIDAARQVFLESGRSGVSTHQIAAAANVNVALIYQHFRSSEELYHAAVLDPLETLLAAGVARIDEDFDAAVNGRAQLAQLHRGMLGVLVDAGPLLGVALFSDQESGRALYEARIEPLVMEFLERRVAALPGRSNRRVDPGRSARAMFGIYLTFLVYATLGGIDFDVVRVADSMADFMDLGLAQSRGMEA